VADPGLTNALAAAPSAAGRATAADAAADATGSAEPLVALAIEPDRCAPLPVVDGAVPDRGFVWVDAHYEAPRAWVAMVERLTGATLLEEHLADAENPTHPSYFDSTRDYEMIVFRGLALPPPGVVESTVRVRTRPTVFFLFPRCVVSVRPAASRLVPALRTRLLDPARNQRLPSRPEELALRILNGMVDRYLELRQPLTQQLEDWQRELLDPRRPFSDWGALLEARRELRKLDSLSEEQLDALQEWRDERLDRHGGSVRDDDTGVPADERPLTDLPALTEILEVRVNDLVEHIERVGEHARRLESSVESAVQLHFAATAHRTNQIMRTLTVLTAVFMPLNLITGIFGMNFDFIPGLHSATAFWITMGLMALLAIALVGWFRYKRYLADSPESAAARRRRRRGPQPTASPSGPPADTEARTQAR
jgi:magnesium transporter